MTTGFTTRRCTGRAHVRAVSLSAAILLSASSLPAWAATGLYSSVTPLTESPPVSGDKFGLADGLLSGAALSADGQTALTAACTATVGAATNAGKAYIYRFADGKWTLAQEIDDPDATTNDNFGAALALSADGTVVLIGSAAPVSGQAAAGKAYRYTLANGTWAQSHEFDDPAATAGDKFGYSGVALSGDGLTAVIGAPGTTLNSQARAGIAYVYSESNGAWTQAAALSDPYAGTDDQFGSAVAVSADGHSLLIGSTSNGGGPAGGRAFLYTLSSGTWAQSREFDDPAATAGDAFGYSGVALSANGQTAAFGAAYSTVNGESSAGKAYVYSESNGVWTQAAALSDPYAGKDDYFGDPVAVSADGHSLLIGSTSNGGGPAGGRAFLYTLSSGTWVQSREFDDPAATAGDGFGTYGVALSADGETAFMSAAMTAVLGLANAGEAYIYQSPTDLSLALASSPASVPVGNSLVLLATVTNTDPAVTAYNVTFTDTLPAGLTYASSNAQAGSCSANGQTVTCTLASLAPDAVWEPTLTVNASMAGSLTDNASVASDEPDPNSANNSAMTTVTVSAPSSSGGGGAFGLLSLLVLGMVACRSITRRMRARSN